MAHYGRRYGHDYDDAYTMRHYRGQSGRGFWGGRPMFGGYGPEYGDVEEGWGYAGTPRRAFRSDRDGWSDPYDRPYRDRWQIDNGDPFGDRARNTPFRMTSGPAGAYDREWRESFRDPFFDRNMGSRRSLGRSEYDRDFGRDRYRPRYW